VQLFALGPAPDWFELRVPVRTFSDYEALTSELEGLDAIKVATWWNTAAPVWRASVVRGVPVYFVQDVETSYYPDNEAMEAHILASYRPEFHFLTTSGWLRERLGELGVGASVVAPGIDLGTYGPREAVARRPDQMLALGRSNPLKNLPLTLAAHQALPEPRPQLRLFGIEPELGRAPDVVYEFKPSDERVNELYNEAAVFLQTSTHEGFCLPALEAMAAGAAVVCTDAHGNRDYCSDGVNCLMPEPDVPSVTQALQRVLDDPELRERLGDQARRTAQAYGWEKITDQLEAFYTKIADGRTGAPLPPDAPLGDGSEARGAAGDGSAAGGSDGSGLASLRAR
jgi:glycosyltransferase involved in cell wall biosynthesis